MESSPSNGSQGRSDYTDPSLLSPEQRAAQEKDTQKDLAEKIARLRAIVASKPRLARIAPAQSVSAAEKIDVVVEQGEPKPRQQLDAKSLRAGEGVRQRVLLSDGSWGFEEDLP